jgi:hypothetical protein
MDNAIVNMIAEYTINCIKKDSTGHITHVGVDHEIVDIHKVAERIWSRQGIYYINAMGIRVRVLAMKRADNNEPYLTTAANKNLPNNIKFLPRCG